MNSRIGKSLSLFALCLVVPMGIARGQTATVTCTDGTTSTSVGKGACSGHGGVKKAPTKTPAAAAGKTKSAAKPESKGTNPATKAAAPAQTKSSTKSALKTAKPESKAVAPTKAPTKTAPASAADKDPKNATAECNDGTYSHAATHTGACSGHGGVKKFLK